MLCSNLGCSGNGQSRQRKSRPATAPDAKLAEYEKKVEETRQRNASVPRVGNTSLSHGLSDYAGTYDHPGYGEIRIEREREALTLQRGHLRMPLEQWHYDAWVAKESDLFTIHGPHPFERASRILFDTSADGEISALSIQLEPAVAPIRFVKRRVSP